MTPLKKHTGLKKYTGWLVLGTLLFYLLSVTQLISVLLPTILAWLANIAMWHTLAPSAKRQVTWLMAIGVAALLFAGSKGTWMTWQQVCAVNLPMLAMFVAVSFLDLTSSTDEKRPLPKGLSAIFNTAIGVQVLGAVINLSVIMVFADRMKGAIKLTPVQQFILTRNFSAAAWWSPFFVATGVALIYAPGMQWQKTLLPGLAMGLVAIIFSSIEAYRRTKGDFRGYPIRRESLFIPMFLALSVILFHYIWPDISILVLICILAPSATLLLMRTPSRKSSLAHFVNHKLPQIGSQFALFLAAGIFSNGISAIILSYPEFFNLEHFTFSPWLFSFTLAVMIAAGVIGIHPVVSVAIASPMLLPLNPDPTQLGFLFLSAWAISAGSSGLTGLGLLMTSRYQIPTKTIVSNSLFYAVFMWLLCSVVNGVFLSS
ncbi:hypothetical protein HGG82_01090 [Marinomonas sp. M1K-6]|uniref:Uncharacterized protein n=1 Tax=Marinomonas profundi TaxID=2726122 RepID=A0A847QZD7_9GAMM|nr:hypothetical protein [Marinomonas profundi]NLQ16215.1 hypothetical protein [Marinomonas profundi]UDV03205.1 hypothetical protein J8N69_16905 [Marinomonas profundi]